MPLEYYFNDITVIYPQLHEKKSYQYKDKKTGQLKPPSIPAYSIAMLMTEDQLQDFYVFIMQHITEVKNTWPEIQHAGLINNFALFVSQTSVKKYDGDDSLYQMSASNQFDVPCGVLEDGNILSLEKDQIQDVFYSGCKAGVRVKPEVSKANNKLKVWLNDIVKTGDGPAIAQRRTFGDGYNFSSQVKGVKKRGNVAPATPTATQPTATQGSGSGDINDLF